jgi:hypothetical protein
MGTDEFQDRAAAGFIISVQYTHAIGAAGWGSNSGALGEALQHQLLPAVVVGAMERHRGHQIVPGQELGVVRGQTEEYRPHIPTKGKRVC